MNRRGRLKRFTSNMRERIERAPQEQVTDMVMSGLNPATALYSVGKDASKFKGVYNRLRGKKDAKANTTQSGKQ